MSKARFKLVVFLLLSTFLSTGCQVKSLHDTFEIMRFDWQDVKGYITEGGTPITSMKIGERDRSAMLLYIEDRGRKFWISKVTIPGNYSFEVKIERMPTVTAFYGFRVGLLGEDGNLIQEKKVKGRQVYRPVDEILALDPVQRGTYYISVAPENVFFGFSNIAFEVELGGRPVSVPIIESPAPVTAVASAIEPQPSIETSVPTCADPDARPIAALLSDGERIPANGGSRSFKLARNHLSKSFRFQLQQPGQLAIGLIADRELSARLFRNGETVRTFSSNSMLGIDNAQKGDYHILLERVFRRESDCTAPVHGRVTVNAS